MKGYKNGHGLSHIIVRRALEGEDGGETLVRAIDVLANGKLGRRYGPRNGERVDVELNGYTAVVSLYRFGNKEAWRLTGFKGMPGAQRVSVNPLGYAPEASGIPQRVVADIASKELAEARPLAAGGPVKGPKERAAAPRADEQPAGPQTPLVLAECTVHLNLRSPALCVFRLKRERGPKKL